MTRHQDLKQFSKQIDSHLLDKIRDLSISKRFPFPLYWNIGR